MRVGSLDLVPSEACSRQCDMKSSTYDDSTAAAFRIRLQEKWEHEAEQRKAREVQEGEDRVGPGPELESKLATVGDKCSLCKSYIERGESIVTADGSECVHTACAEQQGWEVS